MVSKKNKNTINENLVKTKVGSTVVNKDILTFKVYAGANEYTIGELLGQILILEASVKQQNITIQALVNMLNTNNKTIVDNEKILNERLAKLEYKNNGGDE